MSHSLKSYLSGAFMSVCAASVSAQEQKEPVYVDMHAQFIFDVSGSIKTVESDLMRYGIAKALTSKDACQNFDSGLHYALSIINYGTTAEHQGTTIVHSCLEAREFVDKNLWDFDKNRARPAPVHLGPSTDTPQALEVSALVYEREKAYGVVSSNRSVILTGDDDGPNYLVKSRTTMLAEKYNATVYGAPITIMDGYAVEQFFEHHVITPPHLQYQASDGTKRPVKKGVSQAINTPEQMGHVVNQALQLSLF